MLRLQKTSYQQVSLVIERKIRPFNAQILKAALIALIIHFLFLILFSVTPFHFSSTYVFKPIQIEIEPRGTKTDTQKEFVSSQSFSDLIPESLFLPKLEHIVFNDLTLPFDLNEDPNQPLLSLIEDEIWPHWQSSLPFILEKNAFQIFISGPLNFFSWNSAHPSLQKKIPIIDLYSGTPQDFIYDVLVDAETGKIFWYESIQHSSHSDKNFGIEDILKSFIFDISNDNIVVSGKIKIVSVESMVST